MMFIHWWAHLSYSQAALALLLAAIPVAAVLWVYDSEQRALCWENRRVARSCEQCIHRFVVMRRTGVLRRWASVDHCLHGATFWTMGNSLPTCDERRAEGGECGPRGRHYVAREMQ